MVKDINHDKLIKNITNSEKLQYKLNYSMLFFVQSI